MIEIPINKAYVPYPPHQKQKQTTKVKQGWGDILLLVILMIVHPSKSSYVVPPIPNREMQAK